MHVPITCRTNKEIYQKNTAAQSQERVEWTHLLQQHDEHGCVLCP